MVPFTPSVCLLATACMSASLFSLAGSSGADSFVNAPPLLIHLCRWTCHQGSHAAVKWEDQVPAPGDDVNGDINDVTESTTSENLLPSMDLPDDIPSDLPPDVPPDVPASQPVQSPPRFAPTLRRSTRIKKTPAYLKDYVIKWTKMLSIHKMNNGWETCGKRGTEERGEGGGA